MDYEDLDDQDLMGLLEEYEDEQRSFESQGDEDQAATVYQKCVALYNDLRSRGWQWSDRVNEWVRAE